MVKTIVEVEIDERAGWFDEGLAAHHLEAVHVGGTTHRIEGSHEDVKAFLRKVFVPKTGLVEATAIESEVEWYLAGCP